MRLTLVRHGESEGNLSRRHGGHYDFALSADGVKQAAAIAERLKSETFDAIYVSDLTRTKQTAEPIIRTHPNTPATFDERLREKHLGIHEGKHQDEAEFDKWGSPEGGESQDAFRARIVSFIDDLWEHHRDEHVLLVTHGGTITTLLMHLANSKDTKTHHPGNASISIVEFDVEKNHTIHLIGDQTHL